MQKAVDAADSDLFDLLAYVAFASHPLIREARAGIAKAATATRFTDKQQAFVEFVLAQYVHPGVDVLEAFTHAQTQVQQRTGRRIRGTRLYLYLILDLYSRKIVGWEVHDTDDSDHAAHLVRRTALFRTAKYRPEFPAKGFADLEQARTWAAGFVRWYNHDHRHSGIRYVSPAQRHAGEDRTILAARHELYTRARALNPARWSGAGRARAEPASRC